MHSKLKINEHHFSQLLRQDEDPVIRGLVISTSDLVDFERQLSGMIANETYEMRAVEGILGSLFYGWARYSVLKEMLEWDCVLSVEMDETVFPLGGDKS